MTATVIDRKDLFGRLRVHNSAEFIERISRDRPRWVGRTIAKMIYRGIHRSRIHVGLEGRELCIYLDNEIYLITTDGQLTLDRPKTWSELLEESYHNIRPA